MFCSRSGGSLTLNAILQITVSWLWNTATFPVRKMRTSFLSLQTLRISYPSLPPMWPAFEECEFQPSLNISKPMLDIVKLRIFLLCTLMSMKWPRYISWHPRRTLKLLFDLRKARRRSIMHSATHAGQFLRLAETQGGIGIGSTDGKVKKNLFFGRAERTSCLGSNLG